MVSATGFPPCDACPDGAEAINSTTCIACPGGSGTLGSHCSPEGPSCEVMCGAGNFSLSGYPPCTPCPMGFYQAAEGSTYCDECGTTLATPTTGATNASFCSVTEVDNCVSNPCSNGGNCSVQFHFVICQCPPGYTGKSCETDIDDCASQPCYNDAECVDEVDGYTCVCPVRSQTVMQPMPDQRPSFLGDFVASTSREYCKRICVNMSDCEMVTFYQEQYCLIYYTNQTLESIVDPIPSITYIKVTVNISDSNDTRCTYDLDDCLYHECENRGKCKDGNDTYECVCPLGGIYTGVRCQNVRDKCAEDPCQYGNCTSSSPYHRQCHCLPGYTGRDCQTGIDECASSPCFNNGTCVNMVDGFRCQCAAQFSGPYCQTMLESCGSISCGGQGTCVYDYIQLKPRCVCNQGYTQDYFWSTWINNDSPGGDGDMETPATWNSSLICGGSQPLDIECREEGTKLSYNKTDDVGLECDVTRGFMCFNSNQTDLQCQDYEIRFKCDITSTFGGPTCREINECSHDPCVYGSCVDLVGRYQCNCQTGYTGYNCQHNQDNCIYSPCQNGGTCVDLVDGYSCNCTAGYTGPTCEQEVNECNLNPCDSVGTLPGGCGDLLGDFSCQCRPGYTEKQCSVQVDECGSYPCLHGGSCTDRLNGFDCNCTEGWQGNQCQTMVDRCTNNTCMNGAHCENTFTDYFCVCQPGTFGRYCENYPSVCNVTSPCLNDGTCTESGGVASCQCTSDYTGDNCEIQKQHCMGNTCLNGGTCTVTASPPGYSCTCAKGFAGGHCETNIDDCRNVNCGTEGMCIDGVNQHFCHCPINRMGALCDRNVDTDYDMVFGCEGGLVYSSYPVMWNTTEFTIGFWIGVSSMKNTGAVLALHQGRSLTSSYPEILVMSISLSSLDMSFNNDSQTFSFSPSDRLTLTDGGWHAVQVMWEGSTGQLTVLLDGQIAINETYQQGYMLDGSMLLGLGDLYSSNDKLAVEESGFCGSVSLVQAWDRLLQPSEISLGLLQHVPVTTGLIMNWNRYLRERHVSISAPSTRTEQSCVPGIKGPACSTGSVDRKAPQVINCTTSQLVVTSTRTVRVTWDEPMFVDAISVDSNYRPGEQMGQGEYQVVYVAKDIAGNAAFCSFMVYVRGTDNVCTDPPAPYGGQAPVCQQHDGTFFKSCSGPCLPNRVPLRPGPKFHTCGPAGYFNIQNPGEPFIFTPCAELDNFGRKKKITVHMTYRTVTCDAQVAQTIQNEVFLKMEAVHQFQIDSFGGVGICGTDRGANCSNIEVTVTCVDPSTRRTKRGTVSPTTAVDVVIVINNLPVSLGLGVEPEDALTKDILLDGKLNSESVAGGDVINSFSLTSVLLCPSGHQPLGQTCAPCVPGTFYNSSSQLCEDCPLGQYQPATSALTCVSCNSNETTITPRATSMTDCVQACGAGYYFNISGNACTACPRGYYSEQPGLSSCLGCPPGRTTPGEAATSAAQCVDECDSGYELQSDGQCVMCEVGTYREKNHHYLCQNCGGNTTLGRGAVYQEECNITACPPGTRRVGEPGVCDLCPQGSYQPLKWQTNCISCNVSERTDSTGSILPSDCKFFCQAGYFISGTACEPCPLNTYKDAGNYYAVNCTSCPVGAITLTTNATSSTDCKYSECSAGYTVDHARRECIPCPRGFYQPVNNPVHEQCLECPGGTTTASTATASLAGCTKICPSGEYLYGSDCKLCDWGYYKNNSESELASIGPCVICPADYITPVKGGKGLGECTAANCSAGLYRDLKTEACYPCPIGTYQYIRWQTYCKPCPDKKSTRTVGAADISLCVDVCGVGYQNSSRTFQCEPCPIGYYKNWTEIDIEIDACQLCENGLITPSVASTDLSDCRVGNCTAGYYTTGSSCTLCGYGYYQPEKWQGSCISCPEDYTTSIKGSTSSADCTVPLDQSIVAFKLRVLSLDFTDDLQDSNSDAHKTMHSLVEQKILEYLQSQGMSGLTSQSVRVRAFSPGSVLVDFVVYVKVDEVQKSFEAVSAAVNNGILNTLVLDKTVKNVVVLASGVQGCGGGFGLNYLTGVCEPCPLGTYQPAGVENSCYHCPQYYSTISTGSLTKDDCKNICDTGRTYCENGGSCVWAQDKPTCTCPNTYYGEKCHYRKEDSASKNWIIGVTVGVFGGSILVCLAIVGLFAYSRHSKHKKNISSTESTVSSEDFPPYVVYPPQHFSHYPHKYPASRLYMPTALGYVETQYVPAKKSRRDYSPDRKEFSWQEA